MMGFDYEVYYRKGVTNNAADALSRKPMLLQAITSLHSDFVDRIKQSWFQDSNFFPIMQQLQHTATPHSKFTWACDQLRKKGKLVVGKDLQLRK